MSDETLEITDPSVASDCSEAPPRQWQVISGEIVEIVEAETAQEAMAKVFTMFDEEDEPPVPGNYISAIEVIGEELFWSTKHALIAAGRWAGSDANIAARQLSETRRKRGSKVTATQPGDSSI